MGVYNYWLTTKNKVMKIDGVSQPVYLLKYAYKEFYRDPPPHIAAITARIENAWATRDHPRYMTSGFDEGSPVFEVEGLRDSSGALRSPLFGETFTDKLMIVGTIRDQARKLSLKPCFNINIKIPMPNRTETITESAAFINGLREALTDVGCHAPVRHLRSRQVEVEVQSNFGYLHSGIEWRQELHERLNICTESEADYFVARSLLSDHPIYEIVQ